MLRLITEEETNKKTVTEILTEAVSYGASECVMILLVNDEWVIRASEQTSTSKTLGAIEIIKYHILRENVG
jgi:hypothetical protein